MKSLTVDQLIGIIGKIVINHPVVEKVSLIFFKNNFILKLWMRPWLSG